MKFFVKSYCKFLAKKPSWQGALNNLQTLNMMTFVLVLMKFPSKCVCVPVCLLCVPAPAPVSFPLHGCILPHGLGPVRQIFSVQIRGISHFPTLFLCQHNNLITLAWWKVSSPYNFWGKTPRVIFLWPEFK